EVVDNWIGGNKFGIYVISSHNITIGNNFIGSNRINEEIIELGNEADGIYLAEGARDNVIIENFIRFNGANGVYITGTNTIHNRVSHNHISGNGWGGIFNDSGGNMELTPPIISSVSTTSVTGTAIPNATVEIYTDPENEGLIFQGETNSDANGNFTWNGEITGQFTNVTAIAIDEYGNTSIFSEVAVITSVEQLEQNNIPETFSLFQNYPNPFNPRTTIQLEIPYTGKPLLKVELLVYNLKGELIRTLMNEDKSSGAYKVFWDGLDEAGNKVATGIYLYRIRAGEFNATKKMILTK
ncbi:MAG: T9SS type A sorting domain-containing protein, partial [bacterium]